MTHCIHLKEIYLYKYYTLTVYIFVEKRIHTGYEYKINR